MDNTLRVQDCVKKYYNFYNTIPLEMHMAYNFAIQQNLKEVAKVLDILGDRKFNNFVELGSSFGGTLWIYSNLLCTETSDILSIDSHDDRALLYTVENLKKIRPKLNFIKNTTTIGADFTSPIDLLHIDAGHRYEEVMADFKLWSPHVLKGGIIIFHDTVLYPGVTRCVNELSIQFGNMFKTTKITEPPYSCGIAIMEKIEDDIPNG